VFVNAFPDVEDPDGNTKGAVTQSLDDLSQAAGDLLAGGEPQRALELYLEAVDMAAASGSQRDVSDLLGDLAVAYRRTGNLDAAIEANRRAIDAARACGYDLNVARWSGNLGGLLYSQNDIDGAEACFRDAFEAAARTDSSEQISIASGHFASVMGERGRFSEAVTIMADARRHASGSPVMPSIIRDQETHLYLRWAHTLREAHRTREARDVINRALAILVGAPPSKETMLLLLLLGDIEENDGNIVAGSAAVERAAAVSDAMGDPDEATQLRQLARRMRG
jgi:tetratricopeptide (TPR) repeat protein